MKTSRWFFAAAFASCLSEDTKSAHLRFRDKLQAMLDARERAYAFGDGRRLGASEMRRRHRRQDVFDVVSARQRNVLELQYRLFLAVMTKDNFVFPHQRALGHALLSAEPVHVRLRWRQWRGRRVIAFNTALSASV